MADEFGEEFTIYVWPKNHEDGTPFPNDMWDRINIALTAAGMEWETV